MNTTNIFDSLPKEIFENIIKNSDIYAIEDICSASQDICKTINIKNILLDRLKETNDNLDVKDYTTKELVRYSKIQLLKNYITVGLSGETIYVYPDNETIKFYKQTVEMDVKINQVMVTYDKPVVLTTEGQLYIFDGDWKIIGIKDVCSISLSLLRPNTGLIILTKTGSCYIMGKKGVEEIKEPKNIIQMCSQFILTDQGEVYSGLVKIERLPRIFQITDSGIILTTDGKVYIINPKTLIVKKLDNVENIVQIATTKTSYNMIIGYGLNLNGDIINLFDIKHQTKGGYKRIINFLDSFYGATFDNKLVRIKNIGAYSY